MELHQIIHRPDPVDDAIEICRVELPAYLYNVKDAKLSFFYAT